MIQSEFERDPESDLADLRGNQDLITTARSIFRSGSEVGENVAQEGASAVGKTLTNVTSTASELVGETGVKVGALAGETVNKVAGIADEAVGKVGEIAGETVAKAGEIAGETASKAASIASEAGSIAAEAATSVGAVASTAIPIVGELIGLGLGIMDIVTSYQHAPQILATARPEFAAGL
jgi:hypothetical protein